MPATATKTETLTAVYIETMHAWDSYSILRCEVRAENAGKKEPRELVGTFTPVGSDGATLEDRRKAITFVALDEIFDTDDSIVTVKAFGAEEDDFEPGMPFTFYGEWKEYTPKASKWNPKPETQLQFHARKWRKVKPYDKQGVVKWLKGCPGVKEGIARRLWNAFGPDAIARLKDDPVGVSQEIGGGFTVERARMAAAHLQANDSMEAAFVDLASLLDGRGMPHTLPKKLIRDFGADAAYDVKHNPWLLLAYKSTGVARVDKLYLDLGGNPAAIKRQAIILWKCLLDAGNTTGDTWQREAAANEMLKGRIAGAEVKFQKAVELAVRGKLIARRWTDDFQLWLAEGKRAKHEKYIAERVAGMMRLAHEWPDVSSLDLSDHQRERLAVAFAKKCPVLILGGAPGTGKSYTAARVIGALAKSMGLHHIAAGAPTGKAAVRLTEMLDGYGIPLRATTEHTMLGVATTPEVDGWGFKHDEKDPLNFWMIVLDELSMNDEALTAAMLRAITDGTLVVLIGDYNQLPPVGPGRPLYDLIQAGVPYAEFREIQRNAGTIVRACAAIRDGQPIPWDDRLELNAVPPRNLKLVPTRSNRESMESLVACIHGLAGKTIPVNLKEPGGERRPIDPIWDVQVLAATNGLRRGQSEISRVEINKRLQNELNPNGRGVAGSPFRVGDKVMNLKNGWAAVVDEESKHYDPAANQEQNGDGQCYTANGEIGRVIDQEEKLVYVRLDAPFRLLKIPRGKVTTSNGGDDSGEEDRTNTGCNWDLAYGCTIHKYQGSEVPIVLFPMDDSPAARMVMSREALLTAWSRGKWFCICFGKAAVAEQYRKRSALQPRITFLKEEILEAVERLREERG